MSWNHSEIVNSNYLHERSEPDLRKWTTIPYTIILAAVSSAAVGARLWTRYVIQKNSGLEDWLILLGTVLTLVILGGIALGLSAVSQELLAVELMVTCSAIMYFGFDEHTSNLTAQQLVLAAEWLFVGEFAYVSSVGAIKVGILLFYRRLCPRTVSVSFVNFLYVSITFILTYKVVYLTVILNTCKPLPARWNRFDPAWASTHSYKCINETANIFVGSTISAVEDLVIALLPLWFLWPLKIPLKQKVAICSILGMSIFTSIAGFVRSYYIMRAQKTNDHIWEQYWLWICSGLELALGLICASAPALKPFCEHYNLMTRFRNVLRPISRPTNAAFIKIVSRWRSYKWSEGPASTRLSKTPQVVQTE